VPAGVHYVAAPVLVINLFAASPFNDIFYHVIALSVDLMHKTSSASFGPNNWFMVTYQSLNALKDWRNHPSLRNATNSFKKSGVHKLQFANSVLLNLTHKQASNQLMRNSQHTILRSRTKKSRQAIKPTSRRTLFFKLQHFTLASAQFCVKVSNGKKRNQR